MLQFSELLFHILPNIEEKKELHYAKLSVTKFLITEVFKITSQKYFKQEV